MRILGIDPGTATTGFGVIETRSAYRTGRRQAGADGIKFIDCGVIVTSARTPMHERLQIIARDLKSLIRRHKPHVIAIEELFFARNVTNALTVGQARGVALLVAAGAGCDIAEYKPHHVKLAVAGYGRASKSQVQRMVKEILGLKHIPRPDDAADGLAVAITHAVGLRR